jgi:hypothetical protein
MIRFNFLFLILFAGLFYGFISLLDSGKNGLNPSKNFSEAELKYEWTVDEAISQPDQNDLSDKFSNVRYQFLSSGGFVEYKGPLIYTTGSYQVQGNTLEIDYDNSESTSWSLNIIEEELELSNSDVTIRLSKVNL